MGGTNFTVGSLEGLQKYLEDWEIAFYWHKKTEFLDIANNKRKTEFLDIC